MWVRFGGEVGLETGFGYSVRRVNYLRRSRKALVLVTAELVNVFPWCRVTVQLQARRPVLACALLFPFYNRWIHLVQVDV